MELRLGSKTGPLTKFQDGDVMWVGSKQGRLVCGTVRPSTEGPQPLLWPALAGIDEWDHQIDVGPRRGKTLTYALATVWSRQVAMDMEALGLAEMNALGVVGCEVLNAFRLKRFE